MSTPLGGGPIIFAFFYRHRTLFPLISRKSILAIFTNFGMLDYGVSFLLGIAFGSFSYKANCVIAN